MEDGKGTNSTQQTYSFKDNAKFVLGLLVMAVGIGVIMGILGTVFNLVVERSSDLFRSHMHLIWLLPLGGILIAFIYKKTGSANTNNVIDAMRTGDDTPKLMSLTSFISTVITRVLGGSVGTEGAAIQVGGGIADFIGRTFKRTATNKRMLVMCGLSAGFTSIVGTPVTAVALALELATPGIMYYPALMPCALASGISYSIATYFKVGFPKYILSHVPSPDPQFIMGLVVLAALCGLLSMGVCYGVDGAAKLYGKIFPNVYVRAAIGALVIIGLTFLVGSPRYNDGGLSLITDAVRGQAHPWDFALKLLFTALTLAAGFKGGEIVPTLVIGAVFGSVMGPLLGLPADVAAGVGFTAVFCGAINCPITAFLLGLESFGSGNGLYFMIACAVSYVSSGYKGLYSAQRIRFDKLRPTRSGRLAK